MLWRAEDLYGIKIRGLDATIGRIRDLLFDEATWTIRYLVAEEVAWPFPRTLFLEPYLVKRIDWQERTCLVGISREQAEKDPRLHPVTSSATLYSHYPRRSVTGVSAPVQLAYQTEPRGTPTKRSARNLGTFAVRTKDGRPGRVTDLLIHRKDWTISDLLVNVQTPGIYRRTMITPRQIERIDWVQGEIYLDYLSKNRERTIPATATPSARPPRTRRAS